MSRKTTHLSKSSTHLSANESTNRLEAAQPKLAQYVGFFAIGYILASAIFMMIQSKFALNSQLVTVISIITGAFIAVSKFVKHHQRALDRSEMNRLTIGGIVVVWLLTIIYFLAIWFWIFDTISREVLLEMTMQQPLPLLSSLVMILVLTLVSARISLWGVNRLLEPKPKNI